MSTPWPQKILLIAAPFFPSVGGIENIVLSLAHELTARGHKVTVMTTEPSAETDHFRFRVVRQPSVAQVWSHFADANAIIQFGDGIRLGWPLLLKRFPVLTSHQIWQVNAATESPLRHKLRRRIVNRSVNVCCSRAVANRLGAASEVIGNPFNDKLFRRTATSQNRDLIFVGRLIPEKGADLLIESLLLLKRRMLKPSATIVGLGSQLEELKNKVATYNLERQVHFAGVVTGQALVDLLNKHRVLVVPSRWEEPFGIVALEGLACGCEVVASESGGLPEAVGSCGYLFESGNAKDLADKTVVALKPVVTNTSDVKGHLLHFTAASIADRYLELLRRNFQIPLKSSTPGVV